MTFHLEELFKLSMSPIELIVRGSLMYWFLFLIFRLILRRDAGSVGITDFLFVVLLGDASQNAMIGEGTSAADGMVLVATLVFWNYTLDFLAYRSRAMERLLQPRKLCLYSDGKLNRRIMRREFITTEEVMAKVRENGLESLDRVSAMYLEADGEISIIKQTEPGN